MVSNRTADNPGDEIIAKTAGSAAGIIPPQLLGRLAIADDAAANGFLETTYWAQHNAQFPQARRPRPTTFIAAVRRPRPWTGSFGSNRRGPSARTGSCAITSARCNWRGRAATPRPAAWSPSVNGRTDASRSNIGAASCDGRRSRPTRHRSPQREPRPSPWSARHRVRAAIGRPIIRGAPTVTRRRAHRSLENLRTVFHELPQAVSLVQGGHFYFAKNGDTSISR